MSATETAACREKFFDRHITLENPRQFKSNRGTVTEWNCYLSGERVGRIQHCTQRMYNEKPYQACICRPDEEYDGYAGYYDTLYQAKQAIKPHADKYLAWLNGPHGDAPAAFLPAGDFQFYPTPPDVAGKLFAGVDWNRVHSVLEPSAGKGDLLHCMLALKRRTNDRRGHWGPARREFDIDCIEIDSNLQAILKANDFRVIHDDFLTFYSRKCYDLILMNPPFANGDLHLLHALELLRTGGQVACILNAETIRNPYTVSRKALMKELHRLNASIRFYQDAFSKAQRKADVDIAIINVRLPQDQTDTSLWDDLKKAADVNWDQRREDTELAPANNVERLIREYDLLCAAGIDLMRKYNGVAPHIHNSRQEYSHPIIEMSIGGHTANSFFGSEAVNDFLTIARSRYWEELFDLPDVRSQMTSDMRKEYSSTISEMRNYEFSEFNIRQVLKKIMGQLQVGVEEAIVKCFDKLSAEHSYHDDVQNENIHYYNGWKTNKAHYVNMKCIIPTWGCFARSYRADKYGRYKDVMTGLDTSGCFAVLDDLEKALDYLDKGETEPTDLYTTLERAAQNGKTAGIYCKYFTVKFFKKGTCHIQFHDQKIVDRLNIFVGRTRTWLPPSYGKKAYQEMTAEEKDVIDSFQGSEKYAKILADAGNYLVEPASSKMLLLT